ncbi:hypothetical protein [Sphingomonas sp. CFBP 8760]|uniref:hypothetical protein n=1 Tax=Sphingomonas sp. CFBP 8760 TaxID=2775282 RepID=UPI00177C02C4|nr:hypothetical protein [Sphingomonas sp. CFBP 8760]MBD8547775.1 hypothetical protein [Sphingomonas sp. CFBP 8760]
MMAVLVIAVTRGYFDHRAGSKGGTGRHKQRHARGCGFADRELSRDPAQYCNIATQSGEI